MEKIYHFTALHLVSNILNEGINKGVVIKANDLGILEFAPGYQWVTANKSFNQSWCKPHFTNLSYSLTEVRFTISIPIKFNENLLNWLKYCKENDNEMFRFMNSCGDPENWFIYKGIIKPEWIKAIDFDPQYLKKRRMNGESKNKGIKNNSTRRNRGILQIN